MSGKIRINFSFLLLVVFSSFLFGNLIGRGESRLTQEEEAVIHAVKAVKPAVVRIQTYRGGYSNTPVEIGSGVIFRTDGYILTNAHVLRSANRIEVFLPDGKSYPAALVAPADEYDLAVLKIPAQHLPSVRFGNSDELQLGQTAIAIGNPFSFGWTVTKGVISALNREIVSVHKPYHHLIQTDAAINVGNSGGPLVDTTGAVIGINTLVFNAGESYNVQGLGFAIPSNTARKIADELLHLGNVPQFKPQARLGIGMYDLSPELAMQLSIPEVRGVVVESVEPGSPAQKGGLRAGDVITAINGTAIHSTDQLIDMIRRMTPGVVISVEAWRKGLKRSFTITLESATH